MNSLKNERIDMFNIDTQELIISIEKMILDNDDINISIAEYLSLSNYPEIRLKITEYLKEKGK